MSCRELRCRGFAETGLFTPLYVVVSDLGRRSEVGDPGCISFELNVCEGAHHESIDCLLGGSRRVAAGRDTSRGCRPRRESHCDR